MSTEEKKNEQQNLQENVTPAQATQDAKKPLNTPPSTSAPKIGISKRTLVEIVVGLAALLLIILGYSNDGVSQKDYDSLKSDYNDLEESYDTQSKKLDDVRNQFDAYKNKMSVLDSLSDEEVDALIDKADEMVAEKKAKEAEEQKAKDEATAAAAEKQKALNSATLGQKNALSKAQSYLSYSAFSYSGLIEQLQYEGFSQDEATYAADNCGADWNAQADKKAESYMSYSSFSRESLIDQLLYEGFSQEQAEHGAASVGY